MSCFFADFLWSGRTLPEAARDPQVLANEMVIDIDHPRVGQLTLQGTPIRMSETPSSIRRLPPDLGVDGAGILAELGYSETEISALQEERVI